MAVVASPGREKTESMVEEPRRSSSAKPDTCNASSDAPSSVSSAGDPSSDRRDLDLFNQGLATRSDSEEYRLIFKLPANEVLLHDFICALQENILLQVGYLYLFLRHVCFYSNIFGYETKKIIPFNEITYIHKAKTAAIFPNAIEIGAGGKKHFFGSFLSRDEAYRLITDAWAQTNPHAKAFLDRQDSKSSSSTEEGIPINKDSKEEDEPSYDQNIKIDGSVSKSVPNGLMSTSSSSDEINILKTPNSPESMENGNDASVVAANSFWEIEDADAPTVPDYYTMIAEAKFEAGVEEIFKLFFSDDSAGFREDFHKKCGDKEIQISPWTKHEQSGHVRNLSFLHPIKIFIGAKFGNPKEVQKLRVYRNNHIVIETSQTVSDAPFGDYFTVEGRWDVEQDSSERNSCKLRVFIYNSFSKRTIFRGKIEQATKDECQEVFSLWIKLAKEALNKKANDERKALSITPNQSTPGASIDTEQPESSSKIEEPLEMTKGTANEPLIAPDLKLNECADNQLQDNLRDSSSSSPMVVAILSEIWASLVAFTKTSRFGAVLLAGFVVFILLMQVTIIILLTRSPNVHVINAGSYIGNTGSYTKESANYMERRLTYLKEEMRMVGSQMERMQYEYEWLKSHLKSLEKLKDIS
ncbi:GRAM domain family protein isoform X2 [Carex rostrata]